MDTSPLQRRVKADHLPLDQVMANAQIPEAEKVTAASRAFEAVLLRQILGEAQKTVIPSGLTQESASKGIYQDMLTNQLAENLSRGGGLGLGASLERQLQKEVARRSGTPKQEASPALPSQERPGTTPLSARRSPLATQPASASPTGAGTPLLGSGQSAPIGRHFQTKAAAAEAVARPATRPGEFKPGTTTPRQWLHYRAHPHD